MAPQISIRNLGPIGQADLELKPLTIFVGPNNSGKSYAALTIYSLLRSIGKPEPYDRPFSTRRWQGITGLRGRSGEEWDRVRTLLKNSMGGPDGRLLEQANPRTLPAELHELVLEESVALTEPLSRSVDYELQRCFGVTLDDLGRRDRKTDRGEFEIHLKDDSTGFRWTTQCQNDELVTTDWNSEVSTGEIRWDLSRFPPYALQEPERFLSSLMAVYSAYLMNGYSATAHYLPASRSGILQGHKTLASLIVGGASRAWIEPMNVPRLPGVITDLIQSLLLLGQRDNPPANLSAIVQFLESNVTQGRIDIHNRLEYPEINYANESGTFQLHQVSSTISEIAPLVLFLKYLIEPGNLFILEEPESHLDPANQRHLARAIAMMVNADIRVLVTTHSDVFLNQINNLMQVSKVNPRTRNRMGYKAAEVLLPTKVGAYLFRGDSVEGTHVEQLPIDSEYGISTESFDNVHRALYDESIRLEHRARN